MTTTSSPLELIERAYAERQMPLEGGGYTPMTGSIPIEEGKILHRLVCELKPEQTLEIGLANGISALWITAALEANGAGRHIAIDPFQSSHWKNVGAGLIRLAGLEKRLEFREDYSHRVMVDLDREGYRPSFAFIDGSHLFDYVLSDFLLIDRILPIGGLIAFDDSDWEAVHLVIRYVLANRRYEVVRGLPLIEPRPTRSGLAARLLRRASRALPRAQAIVRGSWLNTDEELGTLGRLVALKKLGEDDRNGQDYYGHRDF